MQVHVCPSNPNAKEKHKREGRRGFCFPQLVFIVGVFKGFIARSALILGLGAIGHGLVGKDKRCMGEFALVTIFSSLFLRVF